MHYCCLLLINEAYFAFYCIDSREKNFLLVFEKVMNGFFCFYVARSDLLGEIPVCPMLEYGGYSLSLSLQSPGPICKVENKADLYLA